MKLCVGWACLLLLPAWAGCSQPDTGPEKHAVRGTIFINGTPAERVAVTFHHSDESLPSNHRFATGVTDPEGHFELSTEGEKDGALAGSYRVTFAWMSSPELDAFDMLGGAFSNPSTSEFIVDVPGSSDHLDPFSLEVPEDRIRRPSGSQQSP